MFGKSTILYKWLICSFVAKTKFLLLYYFCREQTLPNADTTLCRVYILHAEHGYSHRVFKPCRVASGRFVCLAANRKLLSLYLRYLFCSEASLQPRKVSFLIAELSNHYKIRKQGFIWKFCRCLPDSVQDVFLYKQMNILFILMIHNFFLHSGIVYSQRPKTNANFMWRAFSKIYLLKDLHVLNRWRDGCSCQRCKSLKSDDYSGLHCIL